MSWENITTVLVSPPALSPSSRLTVAGSVIKQLAKRLESSLTHFYSSLSHAAGLKVE